MSNRKQRAGLLYRMLERNPAVTTLLTKQEREQLDAHYEEHRKRPLQERKTSELALHTFLKQDRPLWPAILGIGSVLSWIALLLWHSAKYPSMDIARLYVFQPLLLAAIAPFSIYILSNLEFRLFFRLDLRPTSLFHSILAFTALTMLLASINLDLPYSPRRMDGFHLSLLLVGITVAPLFEEIAFRQWLPARFGRDPHWWGHLISAVVFTLLHLPSGISMALYYFLCSVTLALVRIQTDSLLWPFLVHAAANFAIVWSTST